jgi:sugar O-acyltransferase (sialic acid O-acetyltransferase NeuD family)
MSESLTPLVFFGATAFPEISQIVRDINRLRPTYQIAAILDDNPALAGSRVEGVPVAGPLDACRDYPDAQFIFGIGSDRLRMVRYEILRRLALSPERYATLVHPSATVYASARVGHGCLVFPGAVIACDSALGDFVQILTNSNIGSRNNVHEGALVASLVATTANVVLGHYCHVGAGSTIGPDRRIGAGAQVGLGSVVLRDVAPGTFVLGNPATPLRHETVPGDIMELWEREGALPHRGA